MIKRFSIVGIRGTYRLLAVDTDGNTHRHYFKSIDRCFRWLNKYQKHGSNYEVNV